MDVDLSAVLNYYNDCWDERFLDGHNSISHACHYGFYSDPSRNNINNTQSEYDKSKKQLNNKLIEIIDKKYDDKLIMLDAGCGYGGTMLDLSRYFINSNIYGITLTNAQIKCTNELLYLDTANRTKVLYGNFNNDDFDIQNNQNHPIKYDIIYFDAFSPEKQPELWNKEIFSKMFNCLKNDGFLVTYCAKGIVQRTMKEVGFHVEVLDGPPGKRQMTKANKI